MRNQMHRLRNAASIACLLLSPLPLAVSAAAETSSKHHDYEILHRFAGSDGADPWDTVAEDGSGNFVGTTYSGGADDFGTVYKIASDGTFTTLYSFKGSPDGQNPLSLPRLAVDKRGNIYGTTAGENASNAGTVFKIAADGTETILYSFTSGSDGGVPYGSVILEKGTNNLYGTTSEGDRNLGTIYELTPGGVFTVLHTFDQGGEAYPLNGLIEDEQHNLYGTAQYGGLDGGWGIVFKLAPDGTETWMYGFFGGDDGGSPMSALVQDESGDLYGTTAWDGANGGGTAFKVAPNGLETTLYGFTGAVNNEPYPSSLVMDKDGNLYGTTETSGTLNQGMVFELTSAGKFIALHDFKGGSDGARPDGGLTLAGKYLFGTTTAGGGTGCGGAGCGTVFRIQK